MVTKKGPVEPHEASEKAGPSKKAGPEKNTADRQPLKPRRRQGCIHRIASKPHRGQSEAELPAVERKQQQSHDENRHDRHQGWESQEALRPESELQHRGQKWQGIMIPLRPHTTKKISRTAQKPFRQRESRCRQVPIISTTSNEDLNISLRKYR